MVGKSSQGDFFGAEYLECIQTVIDEAKAAIRSLVVWSVESI